jgi:exosome complex RNA-binding protein Csl4
MSKCWVNLCTLQKLEKRVRYGMLSERWHATRKIESPMGAVASVTGKITIRRPQVVYRRLCEEDVMMLPKRSPGVTGRIKRLRGPQPVVPTMLEA